MTTLKEIRIAIAHLSLEERDEWLAWLKDFDDYWDRQMAADAKAGKLYRLIAKAEADVKARRLRDFQ